MIALNIDTEIHPPSSNSYRGVSKSAEFCFETNQYIGHMKHTSGTSMMIVYMVAPNLVQFGTPNSEN